MNEGQPARPANMENIVAINQGRQEEPMTEPQAPSLSPRAVEQRAAEDHLILDTRDEEAFGAGHIAGAYNVQLASGQFEQRVGWVLPAERPIILVVEEAAAAGASAGAAAQKALHKLAFVGLDRRVAGILAQGMEGWLEAGLPTRSVPQMSVEELREELERGTVTALDVRDGAEWSAGHIPGARHRPYRELQEKLPAALDAQAPIAVLCSSGQRSSIASSILLRQGFKDVRNVTGGMEAYEAAVEAGGSQDGHNRQGS